MGRSDSPALARIMGVGRQLKEITMDVIKGYVENETMRYLGEVWTERQSHYIHFLSVDSVIDCASVHCPEFCFPLLCNHHWFYSAAMSGE